MKHEIALISFTYDDGVIDRTGKAWEVSKIDGGYRISIDLQMKGRQYTVLSCMKNAMEDIYFNRVRA